MRTRKYYENVGAADVAQVLVDYDLALLMSEWHGGQWTPTYAVSSSALSGRPVDAELVQAAINELSAVLTHIRTRHGKGYARKDVDALAGMIDDLEYGLRHGFGD